MIQQKKTLTRSFSNVVGLAVNVRKKRPIKSNIPTMKSRIIDNPHFLFFVSANDPSEAMYTMITLSSYRSPAHDSLLRAGIFPLSKDSTTEWCSANFSCPRRAVVHSVGSLLCVNVYS